VVVKEKRSLLSSNVIQNPNVGGEPVVILMEHLCKDLPGFKSKNAVEVEADPLVYTEAEMTAAKEAAFSEGYEKGNSEGLDKGRQEEQAKLQAEVDALESVSDGILMERDRILVSSGKDMTKLAMVVAGRMLRKELTHDSEVIVRALEDVLTRVGESQRLIIRLNPAEMDVVKGNEKQLKQLLTEGSRLEFRGDPSVTVGGCVVDTPELHIDAGFESLWERFEDALEHWGESETLNAVEPVQDKSDPEKNDHAA
jgi:flagellar assembly protein FliH